MDPYGFPQQSQALIFQQKVTQCSTDGQFSWRRLTGWEISPLFLGLLSLPKWEIFPKKVFSASSKLEGVFSSSKQVLSNKKWNAPYIPSPKPATRPIVTKPPETVLEFVESEWDRKHLAACLLKASMFGSHTGTSRNYYVWMYVICM